MSPMMDMAEPIAVPLADGSAVRLATGGGGVVGGKPELDWGAGPGFVLSHMCVPPLQPGLASENRWHHKRVARTSVLYVTVCHTQIKTEEKCFIKPPM